VTLPPADCSAWCTLAGHDTGHGHSLAFYGRPSGGASGLPSQRGMVKPATAVAGATWGDPTRSRRTAVSQAINIVVLYVWYI